MSPPLRVAILLYLLPACTGAPTSKDTGPTGDDTAVDDTGGGPDPATVALHGECGSADDFGGFAVTSTAAEPSVYGSVADGVVPGLVLEELIREGDCAVLRRNNPVCNPGCDPGYTCAFDGSCVPYPANQDLGTVTIYGLAQGVAMAPVFPGNTYYDTSLTAPVYTDGALLTLDMPGGVYGPAVLYGVGVETLATPAVEWVLEAGVPMTITWTPPIGAVIRSEIAVQIGIDQHGVSPSTLRCVFADDGEGTIPGAITDALVGVGVTGFPTGAIERRTVDNVAAGAGCLDFTVRSPGTATVDVVGHTPCIGDEDCPKGQTCNEELQICESA